MNIGRTLFWFKDTDENLITISDDFYGLAVLLNRLLNDVYDGKKIKFINLNFSTDLTYELYPAMQKNTSYYYGGNLTYYGLFNKKEFIKLSTIEQAKFIWEKAYKYLLQSAEDIKNVKLAQAAIYAYSKGLEMDLDPDYRVVDTDIVISGKHLRASVWINFKGDGMYSKFTLERSGDIVFEKNIDSTKKGIEFFLDIYKKIVIQDNNIIIKGHYSVDYLPLKIPLTEISL